MHAFEADYSAAADLPDTGTVHVRGRVTMDEAPQFRASMLRSISESSLANMVIELGSVDEMDTSGAAVLAEALKVAEQRGLQVLFCAPSESVLRIFRLAGFEDVLSRCCSTVGETRQRLRG